MKTVMVTGGAGYIGSHIVNLLTSHNICVIVVDYNSYALDYVNGDVIRCHVDIRDSVALNTVFKKYSPIDCVIHCAGELGIARSYKEKESFYSQIVSGTQNVINAMINNSVKKIIFSSSAAVYPSISGVFDEDMKLSIDTMSPYSYYKYLCEKQLEDVAKSINIDYVALRYFNVIGCSYDNTNVFSNYLALANIVPGIIRAAKNKNPLIVNGSDYPTRDGTCIRDYIDVYSLSNLHWNILCYLCSDKWDKALNGVYNCGSGKERTILEMVKIFEDTVGEKIEVKYNDRRIGDAYYMCADVRKTETTFGFYNQMEISEIFAYLWEHS